jgi:hypothetical protein
MQDLGVGVEKLILKPLALDLRGIFLGLGLVASRGLEPQHVHIYDKQIQIGMHYFKHTCFKVIIEDNETFLLSDPRV